MIRYFLAAGSVILLVAASSPSYSAEIPAQMNIPSSVGEVIFRHETHFKERAIPCVECHHQINAKTLNTPHPDYLKSSWINCKLCHEESAKIRQNVYACSECHRSNPGNIADETLSAKVVIHKQCWKCHEAGTAKAASKSCEFCHSGKKTLYPVEPLNVDRSKSLRANRR